MDKLVGGVNIRGKCKDKAVNRGNYELCVVNPLLCFTKVNKKLLKTPCYVYNLLSVNYTIEEV